ncbi:putative C6 transcription factor protein [Neofusicoccum parvum]|uniref:C6 transcription factor protein n=1 Tax=Neofusicoccum parvum TaxID=310453 RepID=A0ACB5SEV5_9PEZI|nr:putative C6 transcription factor protein [Neofusicoccum parvum]
MPAPPSHDTAGARGAGAAATSRRRPTDAGDDSDGERGSNKRRRIALACSTCRCRKSRCDGKRPKCSGCEALGFECSYVQSSSSSNVIVGKEYLSDLETRLERVESRLFAAEAGGGGGGGALLSPSTSAAAPSASSVTHQALPQEEESEGSSAGDRARISPSIAWRLFDHRSDEAEGTTDGIGSISFADEEDAAFLGPSSNIAFMRHLGPALARISPAGAAGTRPDVNGVHASTMAARLVEGDMVRASRRASPTDHSGRRAASLSRDNVFSLPPEAEVRRLMDVYFSNTGLLFPFIHEGTFRAKYEEMRRKGPSSVQKTWLALLNVVLAFAISTSAGVEAPYTERQKESDVFYRRSIALCGEQMLRASSLETVQLQLLTSQYLQGSQKSLQTWMVHGVAVKGALQLGLHCQNASAQFTPVEREFRKRTWFGCILLDRTLSMTFGRPPSIPDEYIKIDLPAPEPLLPGSGAPQNHEAKAISLMFYNATISLYAIMNQTITRCYAYNLGCTPTATPITETVNRVYALETQLQDWKAGLPLDLHDSGPPPPSPSLIRSRARTVLGLRFHNLRILVHRPVLTEVLDVVAAGGEDAPCNPLLRQVGAYNLSCCLESAMETVAAVRGALRGGRERLGAWWFTLYYSEWFC